MTAIARGFTAGLREMFGELGIWGKLFMWLGLFALVAAAGMSFSVGAKMTPLHAVFLAVLSFITAFLPEGAYIAWNEGKRGAAVMVALLSAPLFVIEFGQHAAYTAGIRGNDLAITRVQNTKYDGAQKGAKEDEDKLDLYKRRLADLQAANPWVATVSADSLRAKLASANLAISQEEARGGCKTKCLERMKERDDLASKIALAEETNKTVAMIEATKAALDKARVKADTVEHVSSQTEHMNAFLSKAVAFVGAGELEPDAKIEQGTQLSANLAIALAGTGLPALSFFMAGLFRKDVHHFQPASRSGATWAKPADLTAPSGPSRLELAGRTGPARFAA